MVYRFITLGSDEGVYLFISLFFFFFKMIISCTFSNDFEQSNFFFFLDSERREKRNSFTAMFICCFHAYYSHFRLEKTLRQWRAEPISEVDHETRVRHSDPSFVLSSHYKFHLIYSMYDIYYVLIQSELGF